MVYSPRGGSRSDGRFEDLLTRGIAAVKGGSRDEARNFLLAATRLNPGDARAWIWLSSTTDDLEEQRGYLENALAADPHNGAARRGLVMLSGRVKAEEVVPIGGSAPQVPRPSDPIQAQARTFLCPACGGFMRFDTQANMLRCERCGQSREVATENVFGEASEQAIDFVLPTNRAHIWAADHHQVSCSQCGASSLLPPGDATAVCPFCGSNQLIESQSTVGMVEPHAIIPMRLERAEAERLMHGWLKGGLLTPSDLAQTARTVSIRPAYYPFWTFDADYNANYFAEVNDGASSAFGSEGGLLSNNDHWVPRQGLYSLPFNDVLVPGTERLPGEAVKQIEPFRLQEMLAFSPEFLAGWSAVMYDQSLADASIEARGRMAERARDVLEDKVLITYEKRNFQVTGGDFTGMTYRHILLPLWVAIYNYKGETHHVLINGQTGKIGGSKPRSEARTDALMLVAMLIFFVLAMGVIVWYLGR